LKLKFDVFAKLLVCRRGRLETLDIFLNKALRKSYPLTGPRESAGNSYSVFLDKVEFREWNGNSLRKSASLIHVVFSKADLDYIVPVNGTLSLLLSFDKIHIKGYEDV